MLAKADTERRKLLDAYYANAIDVTTLKAEQARIAADVRAAEERLAAVDAHLAEWQKILETAMRFATNCATASAPTRRRFNQAVFTRIDWRDGKIAAAGHHPRFALLFSSNTACRSSVPVSHFGSGCYATPLRLLLGFPLG
jgi:aminoglycoside/choline kinase family phosphotransferase